LVIGEAIAAVNPVLARYAGLFETGLLPQKRGQGAPDRLAHANEYAAHRLGEINKLGRPIRLMERPITTGDES
jgi:hypothetical protein